MSSREPKHSTYTMLSTVSRTQQVREQIEAAIVRGDYLPGERLPSERELVELLGVSRVSVREAIRSLEALGRVRVEHGRGCFVAESANDEYVTSFGSWLRIHGAEIFELLKVRGALDELAAESAATSASAGRAAARLAEVNGVFRRTDPGDLEALVARDVAFHDAMAEESGSALLSDLLRDLHEIFNESRQATLRPIGRPAVSADEHDAIIRAIAAGDPASARTAVAVHLESVRRSLAELLQITELEVER